MSLTDELLRVLRDARETLADYIAQYPEYWSDSDDLVLRGLDEQIMRIEREQLVPNVAD